MEIIIPITIYIITITLLAWRMDRPKPYKWKAAMDSRVRKSHRKLGYITDSQASFTFERSDD